MNLKVDIWSDVRCPFCYIGKRKFEMALGEFPHRDSVETEWHSFELDPSLQTDASVNSLEYLARKLGISVEQAREMTQSVKSAAQDVGLRIDSGKTVVANTFNAHRLIQLAKTHGLPNEAQDALFKGFFLDGQNIDDSQILIALAVSMGLDGEEVAVMLASNQYEREVRQDEQRAQELGIHAVPFFIFNSKYAISGAQSPETFANAFQRSWNNR